MSTAKVGDIGIVDLGMAEKVCLSLGITTQPRGDNLDAFTLLAHANTVRSKRWKFFMQKLFLYREGTLDGQRMAAASCLKLAGELGALVGVGTDLMDDQKAERLGR